MATLFGRLRGVDVEHLPTPALVVDIDALADNLQAMSSRWPGDTLRTHVKAFKSTTMAEHIATSTGSRGFCCATAREVRGMAAAGVGQDLLLANEVVDVDALGTLARLDGARVTIAVDSPETVDAAATAGLREVLIDVNVGLPRCGCAPADAGPLADRARAAGLEVRGVMGYEGHLMTEPDDRAGKVAAAMAILRKAHDDVGGPVISGGGTGTWDLNDTVTELQAGSYTLMDTDYAAAGVPFRQALHVVATVVSVNRAGGYAVADAGLKAFGMDHGLPTVEGHRIWYCSDEHTTFGPGEDGTLPSIGDRVRMVPAHIDPTIAYHETLHLVRDDQVVDSWLVDLRGW